MIKALHAAVADLFGTKRRFTLIAGPCVAESLALCQEVAGTVAAFCDKRDIGYIFKASFDKANRTSEHGYRGRGIDAGLRILAETRRSTGLPVITDVHTREQAYQAAQVVDMLQIPAFLCRQTDLLHSVAATGLPANIKKGQFLAPQDMAYVVEKFRAAYAKHAAGDAKVCVTERGVSFGYHNLVVDMRGLLVMAQTCRAPVVFDATHSTQQPSARGSQSGGERQMAAPLARAAVAVGVDALFCEVHPNPDAALSDGPNSLTLPMLEGLLDQVLAIRAALAGR